MKHEQRKVREAIQKMAGTWLVDFATFIDCSVDSVDMDKRTCDCTSIGGDSEIQIPSVQLMPEPNDGLLMLPKVGSAVRVGITKRNEPFVVMFSELDSVYAVTDTLWQFNDGSFGGLVKVSDLVTKINNLENKVNDIINAFNTHTHAGVTVGSGATGTGTPPITGTLTPTVRNDIENTLITHGE